MEHRCSVRLPVAMNVLLYHNNIPVIHCKTLNIGADGMFVHTGALKYGTNTMLKVEFKRETNPVSQSFTMPAMVVHHSREGLGLMFPGGNSEAMQAWRDIVRRTVLENSISQIDTILKATQSESLGVDQMMDKDKQKKLSFA
ncbi:PilZ domain-containing protein [Kaarinaea lacus]